MIEKKILVVDDEIAILKLFKKVLEMRGYVVSTAEDSEQALEILKNDASPLIFMDLHMPGMDGLELCRKIRSQNLTTNIFAVTGYASKYEFSACKNAGFNGYFTKPVDFNIIYETAEEIFDNLSDAEG